MPILYTSIAAPARCAAALWMMTAPIGAFAIDTPTAPPAAAPGVPAAPANIMVKPISASRLDITWADKSNNEDNFVVDVSTDGTTYTNVGRTADNTNSFACTGLQPNTVYNVRVKAANSMGESAAATSSETATYSLGAGLTGHYFHRYGNGKPPKAMYTHVDPYISFDWTNGLQGGEGGPEYNFMIVWTGQVTPVYSETYTFYTESDDGSRLWVADKQLVEDWVDQSATEKSGTIDLKAGHKYDIKVGYYANGVGTSTMKLSWSSASQEKEIILPCQLTPKTEKEAETAQARRSAPAGVAVKTTKPAAKKRTASSAP